LRSLRTSRTRNRDKQCKQEFLKPIHSEIPHPRKSLINLARYTSQLFSSALEQFIAPWCLQQHSGFDRDERRPLNTSPRAKPGAVRLRDVASAHSCASRLRR